MCKTCTKLAHKSGIICTKLAHFLALFAPLAAVVGIE